MPRAYAPLHRGVHRGVQNFALIKTLLEVHLDSLASEVDVVILDSWLSLPVRLGGLSVLRAQLHP